MMRQPQQNQIPMPDFNSSRAQASEPPMFGTPEAQRQGSRPSRRRQQSFLGGVGDTGFNRGGNTLLGQAA